jgi:ferredoxin-thioredoxin reductase catalytic subunit
VRRFTMLKDSGPCLLAKDDEEMLRKLICRCVRRREQLRVLDLLPP